MTAAEKERQKIIEYLKTMAQAYDNVGHRTEGQVARSLADDIERGIHES